jgi:hypothetical protein
MARAFLGGAEPANLAEGGAHIHERTFRSE